MLSKRNFVHLPLVPLFLIMLFFSCSHDGDENLPRFEPTACQHTLAAGSTTECGFLVVRENRLAPDSNTIKIHLTIFRSDSNDAANEPVLYLTGGPGAETAAAIELFENAAMDPSIQFYREEFGGNRDIIVVDQRGTNRSIPSLYCSQELGPVAPDAYGMGFHAAANERVALLRQCQDRLIAEGIDLSGYNTMENASDIRDLVTALGLNQVDMYCVSYGTRLCFFIMRRSPEIIRSVVLDSVLPPEINPFEAEVDGTLYALDAFYAAAAAQYPDLQNRVEQMMTRLQLNPVDVSITPSTLNTVDRMIEARFPQVLTRMRANPAYIVAAQTTGTITVSVTGVKFASYVVNRLRRTPYDTALPRKIYQMFDDESYQEVAEDWISNVNFFWPSGGPGSTSPSLGMYNSIFAANDTFFTTPGEISLVVDNKIENDALAEWYLTNFTYMEPGVQHLWDVDPLPLSTRDPVTSDLPTLMLVGGLDPATPQIFSLASAERLSNAFYYVIRSGHATAFLKCTVDMIQAFFADPTTAPADVCAATTEPPTNRYVWD